MLWKNQSFVEQERKDIMKVCNNLTVIQQEVGSPLCKCNLNNSDNIACFEAIKEKLNNDNVIPNGDCPFAYRRIDLSECPCFES